MSWIKNLALVFVSVVFALVSLEAGIRLLAAEEPGATGSADVGMYHPRLGWAPRPDSSGFDSAGNVINILPDGTRSNGNDVGRFDDRPVLAVGDSLVFGDEVNDHESWPAKLEGMLGRRVINGGVNGYGIDQTVLRAEELLDKFNPDLLLFGFYPDDIMRCGLSVRHQPKPFFELSGEAVKLSNVPVPEPGKRSFSLWEKLVSQSALLKRVLPKSSRDGGDMGMVGAHSDHEQVSALLLRRVSRQAQELNIPVVFVIQYNEFSQETRDRVDRVLYYVKMDGYAGVLDFYSPLKKLRDGSPGAFNNLYVQFIAEDGRNMIRHMNAHGNWFIAKNVRDYVEAK